METVTHHGRQTAYRRVDRGGEGTATLCIHGSGGSHALWRGQFRLADSRPVVALDLSGHGESDDVDAEPGYEVLSAYVDDVVAVADATDARVFVGNSLGGAILQWLILEREYPVEGAVFAGTGAKLGVLEDLLGWLDDDFEHAVEFLHGRDRLFHAADEETVERSRTAMRAAGRAVTRRDFRTCHAFDVRDRVGDLDVPATAVVGEHDKLTPRRFHEFFAEHAPDCTLSVIDDAAHLAMVEHPRAFNDAVRGLFDRLDAARSQ